MQMSRDHAAEGRLIYSELHRKIIHLSLYNNVCIRVPVHASEHTLLSFSLRPTSFEYA